jgi:hypothetical protein
MVKKMGGKADNRDHEDLLSWDQALIAKISNKAQDSIVGSIAVSNMNSTVDVDGV